MTQLTAGFRALAVDFPSTIRTNDYWREKYPEMVAEAEEKTLAKLWSAGEQSAASATFDAAMEPYVKDPFRGCKERRVLAEGETAATIELGAARQALDACSLAPEDVELMIVTSFMPDTLAVGNAAVLSGRLGLRGAAWNMESACSGSVVALQTACGLVASGQHRNVLVVASCTYSRNVHETRTMSWFLADGAAAFVVAPAAAGEGLLGGKSVHTADTCGAFVHRLALDQPNGTPTIEMAANATTSRVLRDTSEKYLRQCVFGALDRASLELDDIDFFVFNTPTAWFAEFAANALGVDRSKTISTNHWYANVGPVLMPANLHAAARTGKVKRGDRVLLYSIGSVSSASAAIVRWGDVALGPDPAGVNYGA
jgi:3-oxoacyl-[acyl-carrier-protein] synthase III